MFCFMTQKEVNNMKMLIYETMSSLQGEMIILFLYYIWEGA